MPLKMPDIIDEIIECFSPSDIKKILEFDNGRSRFSSDLDNLLRKTQRINVNSNNRELQKEIADLTLKTAENRNYIMKLKKDMEEMKCVDEPDNCDQTLKAYMMKINEFKEQSKNFTKDFGGIDLNELYNSIENLNEQIQEYKKKIAEVEKTYECYEGFPPDIEQAREAIDKVKKQIKINEARVESFF